MPNRPQDIYNAIGRYKQAKLNIAKDKSILKVNRDLILLWLDIKEKELKNRKGREYGDEIRWSKTMNKYCYLLRRVVYWVKKPLKELTPADIERLYNDLEDGKITTKSGRPYTKYGRKDFYNKVFKSDFFKSLGLKEKAQDIIKLESISDEEVKFFGKEKLDKMITYTHSLKYRFIYFLLFDTGMRIGTVLNLHKNDFEKRYNNETKQDYYMVHIRKEYTKSKKARSISLWLEETNQLTPMFLDTVKDNDFIFNMGYASVRKHLSNMCKKLNIKTRPDKKPVSIHDFRKSCATYWLSKNVSIDAVRARLGHKPSSNAIDRYVSYLGLNEKQTVQQIQQGTYKEMTEKYKETKEQLIVMQENYKALQEQLNELQERIKPNKILNALSRDEEFIKLLKVRARSL